MHKFQRPRVALWTREKISTLTTPEVRQLRVNAARLLETEIAVLCDEVLGARPRGLAPVRRAMRKGEGRRLVSRSAALGMRGVSLHNRFWSRGGVRPSDGAVVMTLWAEDVRKEDGACSYLLWAPNVGGSRPWSDRAAGKERLEHCKLVLNGSRAEGVLVYGEPLEGYLPEDRTRSVHGVDPEIVLQLEVERRGDEYWAIWGRKKA